MARKHRGPEPLRQALASTRRTAELAGRYRLQRRAQSQEETRQRIVAAAVALHTTVGPARTSDSAVAAKAGVSRVTFYRHFPDDAALFRACTAHGLQRWPPPDPDSWREIDDPMVRVRTALHEMYAYYRAAGSGLLVIARDAPLLRPERLSFSSRLDVMGRMPGALMRGWTVSRRRRRSLAAAINLALSVATWHQLIRQQGLSDSEAVELLVGMVQAAAYGCDGAGAASSSSKSRSSAKQYHQSSRGS